MTYSIEQINALFAKVNTVKPQASGLNVPIEHGGQQASQKDEPAVRIVRY